MNDLESMMGEDPQNTSKLVPELQMHVYEHEFWGTVLNAPLVQQMPFHSWKMANMMFEEKTKRVAQAIEAGDWGQVLLWYERPYRLGMLELYKRHMSHEEYREQLASWWIDAEQPQNNYGTRKIVALFKHAGFVMDSDIVDWEAMPTKIPVYRGVHHKRHKRGVSWTLKKERARWFADRYHKPGSGHVYMTVVDKREVLGWFEDRGESEIVIDPRNRVIVEVKCEPNVGVDILPS